MKRIFSVLISFAIAVLALGSILIPTKAETISQAVYLPIILNNFPGDEPIWVKNPPNLPPANGWPGWTGNVSTYNPSCPGPCFATAKVESPPEYLLVEGTFGIFPYLMGMGNEFTGCYGVLVTEDWEWVGSLIFLPTGNATFKWMSVPNPLQAPPLEWAAQMRQEVINDIPGCINPDIGVYAKPSRMR